MKSEIEQRIAARELFEDLLKESEPFLRRLWQLFDERYGAKPKPALEPMSENAAANFETLTLPYGAYKGQRVGDVPPRYLLFIVEGDGFREDLLRYLKSARFMRRQDDVG